MFTVILALGVFAARSGHASQTWENYGHDPQHSGLSLIRSQSLAQIVWQMPVDLHPQYNGNTLLIHYGSPVVTNANTVLVPVKTGVADTFRVEARNGNDGSVLWMLDSDYTLPPHNWTPPFGITLTPAGRLVMPGAGGTVIIVDGVDTATPTSTRVAFYGIANYNANPSAFNADLKICTPLISDAQGNVFFGFRASGGNPLAIHGGVARIASDGSGSFSPATAMVDSSTAIVALNCAPAISPDGGTVYISIRNTVTTSTGAYLVALDATTLALQHRVLMFDPKSGLMARVPSDGSATPMVGTDGRVYFGVLENPSFSNDDRGWLLQFDANLAPSGMPGSFGWDDTPSRVPPGIVPSYTGTSPYLLMTKYNNYAGAGAWGDGINQIAVLDPSDTQIDSRTGIAVMKEILTIKGATPDSAVIATYPNAVREWCINDAAVDPFSRSILANSEDGRLYRWDLTTNSFSESITLTPGLGEAYTPTLIGRDGRVYAINNATLFSVGTSLPAAVGDVHPGATVALSAPRPDPVRTTATLRYSLPRAGDAHLDVLDIAGRRVATLVSGTVEAGDHVAQWDARDPSGARAAAGIFFARLTANGTTITRRFVLTP